MKLLIPKLILGIVVAVLLFLPELFQIRTNVRPESAATTCSEKEQVAADWLWRTFPPFTFEQYDKLTWLKKCEYIDLQSDVDWNTIEYIQYVQNLRIFQFYNNRPLSKECFRALATLPKLDTLAIYGDSLTDLDISLLANIPKLKSLGFNAQEVTTDGFRELERCPQLTALYIYNASLINDSDLQVVKSLPNLERILITSGFQLTYECLFNFEDHPRIESIGIYASPKVSQTEVMRFERNLLMQRRQKN